jgi:hypothetical protein
MIESIQLAGLNWYDAADYQEVKALMIDRRRLPSTHFQWMVRALALEARLIAEGDIVVRVTLRPEEFRVFCLNLSLTPDAHGRDLYAMRGALGSRREGHTAALYRPTDR